MNDDDLACKLDQLTPENLLSIFRALLLCEVSLDHIQDSLSEIGRKLIDPLGDQIGIGDVLEGDFRRSYPGESADIGMSRAA